MTRGRTGIGLVAWAGAFLGEVPALAATLVADVDACNPTTAILADDATLVGARGRYRLVLVTGTGERTVSGLLELVAFPPGRDVLGSASTPLQGSTDVDPRVVGARRIGDPASKDPDAPGVLVLETVRGGGRQILLRLGSDANRVDRRLYDAGYTVLRVQQIDAGGFSGTWESGARSSSTTGHFCAKRL